MRSDTKNLRHILSIHFIDILEISGDILRDGGGINVFMDRLLETIRCIKVIGLNFRDYSIEGCNDWGYAIYITIAIMLVQEITKKK